MDDVLANAIPIQRNMILSAGKELTWGRVSFTIDQTREIQPLKMYNFESRQDAHFISGGSTSKGIKWASGDNSLKIEQN